MLDLSSAARFPPHENPILGRIYLNEPVKGSDNFQVFWRLDFSRAWFWNSWGFLFNLLNQVGFLDSNFWSVPFGMLAYTSQWGEHSLLSFPRGFSYETFGYTLANVEWTGPKFIETVLAGKGIKKVEFEFIKWRRPESCIMDDLKASDIYTQKITFLPMTQGISSNSRLGDLRPFYKTILAEEGFENLWSRRGTSFAATKQGQFFKEAGVKAPKTDDKSEINNPSAFFSSKHLVHSILINTMLDGFWEDLKIKLAGKKGTLVGTSGKDQPGPRDDPNKWVHMNLDEFQADPNEFITNFLFFFQDTTKGRAPSVEGDKTIELPYRTENLNEVSDERLTTPIALDRTQRGQLESRIHSQVLDFRNINFILTKDPKEGLELVSLRTEPALAHFLGAGAVTNFHLLPLQPEAYKLLIISWAYALYHKEDEVYSEVELQGIKLNSDQTAKS